MKGDWSGRGLILGVLLAAALVMAGRCLAQTSQEMLKQMRSKVIETIDGRDYYIHTIKRGQTLYMISKAYGVDVNELVRENPDVKEGIKADQKLRVPLKGPRPADAIITTKNEPAKDVKEEEKAKPAKPKSQATPAKTKGKPASAEAKPVTPPPAVVPAPVPPKDSVVVVELPCGQDSSTKKKVYSVALMLPLALGEVDRIQADNPDPATVESIRSFQFLPFYEGFRMAYDSLQKAGLKIRLFVYDVDKDTSKTRQVLKKPEMKSMDLIIGLLYQRNFQIVADFAKKNRIGIVNPISERSDLVTGNPYVFKVLPAKKAIFENLADYLAKNFHNGKLFIIRNGQYSDREAADKLKKECLERDLDVRISEGQDAAISLLSKEKENVVIVFSDNAPYAFDLGRRFFELRNDYNLTLFGLPDWSSLEGMDLDYLVSLKTHIIVPSFIDYSDPGINHFVKKYQEMYSGDPSLLAFQGFDAATYFLSALRTYGTNLQRCIADYRTPTLLGSPEFRQSKGNGFENNRWTIVKYENFRLVRAN